MLQNEMKTITLVCIQFISYIYCESAPIVNYTHSSVHTGALCSLHLQIEVHSVSQHHFWPLLARLSFRLQLQ